MPEQVESRVVGADAAGTGLQLLTTHDEIVVLEPLHHGLQRRPGAVVVDGEAVALDLVRGAGVPATGGHQAA